MPIKGLVQVYTGDGKGKTTAAWGLALRALGQGLRVCFVMFMKGDSDLGELKAAARLGGDLEMRQFGASREELAARMRAENRCGAGSTRWWKAGFTDDDRRMASEGLDFARQAIAGGEYDLVILDEANVAMDAGLLDVDRVLAAVRGRPAHVEIVLTGRAAPQPILQAADLVTEMRAVKHPFDGGVPGRRGIEY